MVLGQSGSYSHLILDTLCLCHGLFISSNKENFIVSGFIGFLCEFMQLIFHRGVFELGDISLYVVGILLGLYVKEKYHVHLKEKSEVHGNE